MILTNSLFKFMVTVPLISGMSILLRWRIIRYHIAILISVWEISRMATVFSFTAFSPYDLPK